jgi:hypothetical protein
VQIQNELQRPQSQTVLSQLKERGNCRPNGACEFCAAVLVSEGRFAEEAIGLNTVYN